MSEEDNENLTYHDRCRLLNSNPVLVARHLQYWVEVFFKKVVDGPLGKTKHCALFSVVDQCSSFNFKQQGSVCCFC